MSVYGSEHVFSVHCLILVHFALGLPQLGMNCRKGIKRLKRGIWVRPQSRQGHMVRT